MTAVSLLAEPHLSAQALIAAPDPHRAGQLFELALTSSNALDGPADSLGGLLDREVVGEVDDDPVLSVGPVPHVGICTAPVATTMTKQRKTMTPGRLSTLTDPPRAMLYRDARDKALYQTRRQVGPVRSVDRRLELSRPSYMGA
jgi:hypothetical protein